MGTMTMERTVQSLSLAIAIAKPAQVLILSASLAIQDSILIRMLALLALETAQFVQAEQPAATAQPTLS